MTRSSMEGQESEFRIGKPLSKSEIAVKKITGECIRCKGYGIYWEQEVVPFGILSTRKSSVWCPCQRDFSEVLI